MLAVVKKPHTEMSINGRGAKAILDCISQKFDVSVISQDELENDTVAIEHTNFWKEMQSNRVGNLLAGARLRAGMTQKQLADAAGIKQTMISDYERGKRRLTESMAKRFAKILGAKVERLQ